MSKEGKIRRFLEETTDLSGEAAPGQSILELLGDNRVLVENHRGVQEYSRERIGIRMRFGSVCILGCGLELMHMTRDQLVIRGRIDSVQLNRR